MFCVDIEKVAQIREYLFVKLRLKLATQFRSPKILLASLIDSLWQSGRIRMGYWRSLALTSAIS